MNITSINVSKPNFKGYDAIPLKGLAIQYINSENIGVSEELEKMCKQEGIDLHLLSGKYGAYKNDEILHLRDKDWLPHGGFRLGWAQDGLAFLDDKNNKANKTGIRVLNDMCDSPLVKDTDKKMITKSELFKYPGWKESCLHEANYQGGNYYIYKNKNGERSILVGEKDYCPKAFAEKYDVKEENVHSLSKADFHIDLFVRPIGYPYILVDDPKLAIQNVKNIAKGHPEYKDEVQKLVSQINNNINDYGYKCDKVIEELKSYGFKPIRIAGKYGNSVNFINAVVNKKDNGSLSYITGSTKHSTPFMKELEAQFKNDLMNKTKEKGIKLAKIYNIAGDPVDNKGIKENQTMHMLNSLSGGIHCLCAEIPNFNKVV